MSSLSSDFNDARGPASPFHWTGLPIESDMNFFPDFAVLIHALRKCSVPSGRAILPSHSSEIYPCRARAAAIRNRSSG